MQQRERGALLYTAQFCRVDEIKIVETERKSTGVSRFVSFAFFILGTVPQRACARARARNASLISRCICVLYVTHVPYARSATSSPLFASTLPTSPMSHHRAPRSGTKSVPRSIRRELISFAPLAARRLNSAVILRNSSPLLSSREGDPIAHFPLVPFRRTPARVSYSSSSTLCPLFPPPVPLCARSLLCPRVGVSSAGTASRDRARGTLRSCGYSSLRHN